VNNHLPNDTTPEETVTDVVFVTVPVHADGQLASEQWETVRLTPELRQWALQLFTEEEILAGLRELREQGGLELRDFLPELEQIVGAQ
jgi:hypothetical protein